MVANVRDFGAAGDGVTDDSGAVRRALVEANAARGTLFFPAGTYAYGLGGPFEPAEGVTVAGEPGRSILRFQPPSTGEFASFSRPLASRVTFDGLVLERAADFPCVFLAVPAITQLTLSRMSFVGNQDRFTGSYCHGVQLGVENGGTTSGLRWTDSVATTMTYALFQTNDSTAVTEDVEVSRCRFAGNADTDLEFNSPKGATRRVLVEDCEFRDHGPQGFAVGLATCTDVTIRHNTMAQLSLEAIHVEDYSENVIITGNRIMAAGLAGYSHVQLIGGARRITVTGNAFDASANTNAISVVYALAGGSEPTPGGRPVAPPSGVEVTDNDFVLAEKVSAVTFEGVTGGAIRDNRLSGPRVTAGEPSTAIATTDSTGIAVGGNTADGEAF
ncbi:glycosyl hydrolase family 28-related protein [Actinomycetospora lutea]|nr:right-handed parallel beta-helix repeat-containing protein [Actinomycetospora lutea]MDD7942859.1 glycosyl hydrolase family 28-related protein [Actinomycetospora lutea]